jgi:hypothetical protein
MLGGCRTAEHLTAILAELDQPVAGRLERAEALTALARISLTHVEPGAADPLVVLERISLTHVAPIPGQEDHLVTAALIRAVKSLVRRARSVKEWARTALIHGEAFLAARHDLERTSLSRDARTGAPPGELERLSLSSSEYEFPAWGEASTPAAGEDISLSTSFRNGTGQGTGGSNAMAAENSPSSTFPRTSLD